MSEDKPYILTREERKSNRISIRNPFTGEEIALGIVSNISFPKDKIAMIGKSKIIIGINIGKDNG